MHASKSPLVLAFVDPPHGTQGGDWYYRAYVPGAALAAREDVHVVYFQNNHRARKEILRDADVVVLNAICDQDLFPVIAERKAAGRATVFEINDDFRAVQAANPVARFFAEPGNRRILFRLAHLCGANQFTVPELRRLYGSFASRHAVFANHLPRTPAPRTDRVSERVIMGWGGSKGHLEDVRRVAPTLRALLEEIPELDLHVMGAEAIADLFRDLPSSRFRHVASGTIDEYHAFVATLDIGLAPLENDGFNRSRSDVKFLEYACHGVVPLVQRLEPYLASVTHGANGFLFESPEELAVLVRGLVRDPGLRSRVSDAAYRSVATTRLEPLHTDARLAFYNELLAEAGHRPHSAAEAKNLVARWAGLAGARREGRLVMLDATDYERHLHAGLLAGQRDRDPRTARRHFEAAASLCPNDHLPWLYLGTLCDDLSATAKAVDLEPRSVSALLAVGRAFAAAREPRALQILLRAAELEPSFEVPYAAVAAFFEETGHAANAAEFRAFADARAAGFDDPKPLT